MSLIVKNYELPDGLILENAYFRVQSILTANQDYETLVPTDIPGFDLKSIWEKRVETTANIFVFGDKIAKENGVPAIHWFQINFDYDLSQWTNIFEQAYLKLKEKFPESEDH